MHRGRRPQTCRISDPAEAASRAQFEHAEHAVPVADLTDARAAAPQPKDWFARYWQSDQRAEPRVLQATK